MHRTIMELKKGKTKSVWGCGSVGKHRSSMASNLHTANKEPPESLLTVTQGPSLLDSCFVCLNQMQ